MGGPLERRELGPVYPELAAGRLGRCAAGRLALRAIWSLPYSKHLPVCPAGLGQGEAERSPSRGAIRCRVRVAVDVPAPEALGCELGGPVV